MQATRPIFSHTSGSTTSSQSGKRVDVVVAVVDVAVDVVDVVAVVVDVVSVGISPSQAWHLCGHINLAASAIDGCVHMNTSM